MNLSRIAIYSFVLFFILFSCKKDKTALPEPEPELTKWEKISGHYKVYDTTGIFLYEMDLVHVPAIDNDYVDSIRFENFDGEFTFTDFQSTPANYPMNISIGYHDTLYDGQGKRWKIFSYLSNDYNQFSNDSIKFHFA